VIGKAPERRAGAAIDAGCHVYGAKPVAIAVVPMADAMG
jgi:hypothetical protein